MLPGGGRSGRGGRSRGGGGGGGGRSNADRDRNDSATVTGNEEIGFFTSRGQAAGGPVRQTGGPVRQTGRRGGRSSGGILRGAASLPPRPTRGTDQDGDLAMGAEKKNFSPYQRPKRNNNISSSSGAGDTRSGAGDSIDPTGTVVIFVTGRSDMPSLANDSGLYDFLNRKASPMKLNITSKRTNEMSGVMSFVVGDFAQARVLRNLSGIRYKGQKLSIKTSVDDKIASSTGDSGPSQRPSAPPSHGTIDAMRNFMRSRYNNGFLNLENMAQDSILRAAKIIPPGQTRGRSDVGTVMMKVAAELFPETTTISFAMNGIRSLQPISAVSIYFPNLQNLSFKGNNIQYFRDLEYLSGKKLPHLKELILLDNPVRDRDLAKNNDDLSYRSSVLRLFPSIVMLDQVPVTNKISFGLGDILKDDLPEHAVLPAQIKGNFFDNAGTEATALEFLASYLKLFDTNRRSLEHAYDMNATFSLQTMTPISPLQKRKNQAADNWAGYISHSRNLSKIKDLDLRVKKMFYGSKSVVQDGLVTMPETKHDLSDASKFCVDAWQTGGLLPGVCIYICLHGEFEELHHGAQGLMKSFDRTFIIAPAPPGSSAAMNGWKCLIISDQLTIRGYNGSEAWQPELALPMIAGANGVPSAVTTPQVPMPGVSAEQHVKAQELQRLTGLNYPYALQCLTASGWDVAKGVALVEGNRANIPADAWQQPTFS